MAQVKAAATASSVDTVDVEVVEATADIQPLPSNARVSDVWTHYRPPKKYNGKRKAQCKLCDKWISAVNTTNLRCHVNIVHKHAVEQAFLNDSKVLVATVIVTCCCIYLFIYIYISKYLTGKQLLYTFALQSCC